MAFSKVKVGGLADDSVTAANVDDDGTGYTVGNLTNSGTLQQTGQVTLGSGGTNWTLPTSRGNNKYVLQIQGGAADWAESLVAPEISSHSFDVSGSTDDGGINDYEAPYAYTGTTTNASTTISSLSSDTGLKVGQYISGPGIPANTTISSITNSTTIVISNQATAAASGVALKIQKTPGEKNGGKVTLTGTNFGVNVADILVAITNSAGSVIANASYLSGLSATSVTAEWTGTEGSYSTDLTSSYDGKIYFKIIKSGLDSNVYDSNTTLTSDATLSTPSQTGGDLSVSPGAATLGTYGTGKIAGGGQNGNTKLLLNFDRTGGTDLEDSSNTGDNGYKVSAHNQAVIKSTPFGDGKSAMYFDGSDDRVVIPNHADFTVGSTNAWSIDFWVCADTSDYGGFMAIGNIGANDVSSNQLAMTCYMDNQSPKQLHVYIDDDNSGWNIMSGDAGGVRFNDDLRWHHIAVTYGGNPADENYRVYFDGILKKTTASSSQMYSSSGNQGLVLGCNQEGTAHFKGYLDEVRWVVGENPFPVNGFTPSQYRYGTTGATHEVTTAANMKALIHSDQTADSSSRQHTLSLHTPAFSVTQGRANWGGSNLVFDGSDDKIRISANPDFELLGSTSTNRTVDFWVYHTSNPASGGKMYLCQYDASSPYWEIRLDSASINFTGSSGLSFGGAHGMSVNTWYHIAVTKVGTACKIYVGGVLKASGTQSGTLDLSSNLLTIGARQTHGDMYWAGYMDEIRISDIDRTASGQDLALSGSSFTPPTSAYTSDSNTTLLIHGDGAKFTDSATTGTTHTVTATGAFHSQNHKGIVSSMPWPANGKKSGASGVYFDGSTDYLELKTASALGTGKFTIDFWLNFKRSDSTGTYVPIMGNQQSTGTSNVGYFNINLKKVGSAHNLYVYEDSTQNDSGYAVDDGLWHHCMVIRNSDSYLELWVDGTRRYISGSTATTNYDSTELWRIGHDDNQGYYYKGYLDNIRIAIGEDMTSVSTDPVYSANGTTYTVPTRAYGTFGVETPDAGTITLVATGDGDYTWSEMSAGTALPGSLAVGSTTHSGSGNSRTHTATITGAFTSVSSDVTTNNILLKAQNDADATKAITLGSSGGYDGISVTQKSSEKPVLFNARRYVGTGAVKDINGLGIQADLVWFKERNTTNYHALIDSVRGGNKVIFSNATNAEASRSANEGYITSFNSDGFSLDPDTSSNGINTNNQPFIAWAWKAGGAPSGTLAASGATATLSGGIGNGTIHNSATGVAGGLTSITQSVNQNTGFSITKFRGVADGGAFPHNLGGVPSWVIVKQLTSGVGNQNWSVWHKNLTATTGKLLFLNTTAGEAATTGYFDYSGVDMGSNTTQISIGSNDVQGGGAVDYICYAWREIANVSKFGSYTGNGSTYNLVLGFHPRFIIIKRLGTASWHMFDTFRSYRPTTAGATDGTGNSLQPPFFADTTGKDSDINTNSYGSGDNDAITWYTSGSDKGIRIATNDGGANHNGDTYIYMAFA